MSNNKSKSFQDKVKDIINNTKDDSKSFTKKDKENGKLMAILSYITILSLIPYFVEKENKYVIYHAKQGLNLFIIEIIVSMALGFIGVFFWMLWFLVGLVSTAFRLLSFVLSIMGIINVCNGKAKELPLMNKLKIIK